MKVKMLIASICIVLCGVLVPFFSVSAAEELEEKTAYITDEEFSDIIEEQVSNLVSTRAMSYSLNWRIPAKRRCVTGYFKMSEGSYVSVVTTLSKTAWAGIIKSTGEVRYVEGTKINKTFEIDEAGYYCVFIQNKNDKYITSKGYYFK